MMMRIYHWFIISVSFVCLGLVSPLQATERIALVIGNGDYEIKPLDNPPHDAEDVAKMLRQVGFQAPIVEINADQATMDSAIAAFGERLHKGAVGLFYYAGHAVQYGGENYLIPVGAMKGLMDSPEQLKYKAVNATYVLEVMESAGNGLNIIILDACRDNPFKSKFSKRVVNSPRGGLAEMPKANGSVIAYATAPGETAKDGSGRNSPYTKQFLQWMQKPNLPIELMLKEVGKGVKRETQEGQRPWYASSIDGDFYFVEPIAKLEEKLPEGAIIAFATSPNGVAMELKEHGLYTKFLLQEMQKPQQIEEVFRKVSRAVTEYSKSFPKQQVPWYNSSLSSGSFCLGGCSKTSFNSVKQLALVIGNNNYYYRRLESAIRDAESVAKVLDEKGFEVILKTDLDLPKMNAAIQEFGKRLSIENGVGFFYFSGDGKQINGEDYLVPVDFDIEGLPYYSLVLVSVAYVVENMQSANRKLNIIILDICRDSIFSPVITR